MSFRMQLEVTCCAEGADTLLIQIIVNVVRLVSSVEEEDCWFLPMAVEAANNSANGCC